MQSAADTRNTRNVAVAGKELPLYVKVGEKERYKKTDLRTKNPGALTKEEREKIAILTARQQTQASRDAMLMRYGDLEEVAAAVNDPEELEKLEKKHSRVLTKNIYGDNVVVYDNAVFMTPREKRAAERNMRYTLRAEQRAERQRRPEQDRAYESPYDDGAFDDIPRDPLI